MALQPSSFYERGLWLSATDCRCFCNVFNVNYTTWTGAVGCKSAVVAATTGSRPQEDERHGCDQDPSPGQAEDHHGNRL